MDITAKEINELFGSPFLPDGFVKARSDARGFHLRIGDRDVAFDENGKVWAVGTNVGPGQAWDIRSNHLVKTG